MGDGVILYVDDERANRVVFEQAFAQRFSVRCVASGEEALAILEQGGIDILVTDQRMPGMSGHELLQRAHERWPDVVRVVITAYSDIDPILRAVNEGLISRYLVKPWDRAELEQILTWSLQAAALARHDGALQMRLMESERLVTIGTIGAAVIHDLQAPIASMRLNITRLIDHARLLARTDGADPARRATARTELPELAEDLRLATEMMQGIVGQLRGFLERRSEGADATPEAGVDPAPVIRYATTVCRQGVTRTASEIVHDGPATLPRVRISAADLAQVLMNVIWNGALALEGKEGRVVVSTREDNDQLHFEIADNGRGMSAEVLRRAGTAFYSTRAQGTGLGLLQCHRLLGQAGSKLVLTSEPGRGTTVRFALPIVR